MAVTRAELDVGWKESPKLGGRRGTFWMILCNACGVAAFVLCVLAEAFRSRIAWAYTVGGSLSDSDEESAFECIYTSPGRTPLACAVAALLLVVLALTMGHTYLCNAIFPPGGDPNDHSLHGIIPTWASSSVSSTTLKLQIACSAFLSWICFSVTAVLLMIGIAVEADHLGDWKLYHLKCLVVRKGLFATSGMLALASTSLNALLYLVAKKAHVLATDVTSEISSTRENNFPTSNHSSRHQHSLPIQRDSGSIVSSGETIASNDSFMEVDLKGL